MIHPEADSIYDVLSSVLKNQITFFLGNSKIFERFEQGSSKCTEKQPKIGRKNLANRPTHRFCV